MNLKKYVGTKVKIVDVDNQIFEGIVTDYLYPDENNSNSESIIVDCTKGPLIGNSVEFWSRDMKRINIIQ